MHDRLSAAYFQRGRNSSSYSGVGLEDTNQHPLNEGNPTMAMITYKVAGASKAQSAEASTVGELKRKAGLDKYSATINGDPADDSKSLEDGNYVTFAPSVKGGI